MSSKNFPLAHISSLLRTFWDQWLEMIYWCVLPIWLFAPTPIFDYLSFCEFITLSPSHLDGIWGLYASTQTTWERNQIIPRESKFLGKWKQIKVRGKNHTKKISSAPLCPSRWSFYHWLFVLINHHHSNRDTGAAMCYLVHVLEARVWQHHVVEGQCKVL